MWRAGCEMRHWCARGVAGSFYQRWTNIRAEGTVLIEIVRNSWSIQLLFRESSVSTMQSLDTKTVFTEGKPGQMVCWMVCCSRVPKNEDSVDISVAVGKSSVAITFSFSPTNSSQFSRTEVSSPRNVCWRCHWDEAMYLHEFILCSVLGAHTSQLCVLDQTKKNTH